MIRLLGSIDFPVQFPHRPQTLLAYLVTHSQRLFHRDELVDSLLFSNRKELRQALWQLGSLKEACAIEGEFIGFNGYPADVIQFERDGNLDAYCGPLLPGWADDWVIHRRVALDMLFFERASIQMRTAFNQQRYEEAESIGRKMLRIDPSFTPALNGICVSLEARGLDDIAARSRKGGTIEI